jgi:hypothetical protein
MDLASLTVLPQFHDPAWMQIAVSRAAPGILAFGCKLVEVRSRRLAASDGAMFRGRAVTTA